VCDPKTTKKAYTKIHNHNCMWTRSYLSWREQWHGIHDISRTEYLNIGEESSSTEVLSDRLDIVTQWDTLSCHTVMQQVKETYNALL